MSKDDWNLSNSSSSSNDSGDNASSARSASGVYLINFIHCIFKYIFIRQIFTETQNGN